MPIDISIVLPVYNESESLQILYDKIKHVMSGLEPSWEIVFIDDGSTDGSRQILKQLHEQDNRISLGIQRRNFGKSVALMMGFELARGTYIITMDSDLQDDPEEIPILLAKLNEGYDIVTGWKHERQDPLSKRIPSKIANFVTSSVTGLVLNDMNSGLKAYTRECAKNIHIYGELHRYIPVIAHMDGYRVSEIPVKHHARQFGQSKYGAGRLLKGGFDFITILFLGRYGQRPLHFFGIIGGGILAIGLLINLKLTIDWFNGIRPIGDRPLLLLGILMTLVGIQLLSVGLIAELIVAMKEGNEDPLMTARHIFYSSVDSDKDAKKTLNQG